MPRSRKRVGGAAGDLVVAAEQGVGRRSLRAAKSWATASRPQASDQTPGKVEVGDLFQARRGQGPAVAARRRRTASNRSGPVTWAMRRRPSPMRCSAASVAPPSSSGTRQKACGRRPAKRRRGPACRDPARRAGPAVGAARGDDEAVDALAEQLLDMLALALRIVGGVAHEDGDAAVGEAPRAPP